MLEKSTSCISKNNLFRIQNTNGGGGGGGQAFSQRGVRVSIGHPIADFGHPNIHIFCV